MSGQNDSSSAANQYRTSEGDEGAVRWQRRYEYPLPDGTFADWHDISREQYHISLTKDFTGVYSYRALYPRPPAQLAAPAFDMLAHLQRQREWSGRTFGPGPRTAGVVDHIRKELREIEADPTDLSEWIDVVILALDGAWRAGGSQEQTNAALVAKQKKNEGRQWPDWRTADPDKAIEHDRSADAQVAATPNHDEGREWIVGFTGWTKADGKTLWMEHDGEPVFRIGKHPDIGTNRAIYSEAKLGFLATQPAARRVTDEDVEKSLAAYWSVFEVHGASTGADGAAMRAALESFAQSGAGSSSTSSDLAAEGVSE